MTDPTNRPWRVQGPEYEPYGDIRIVDSRGQTIAKICLDDAPVEDFNRQQWANAQLIVDLVNASKPRLGPPLMVTPKECNCQGRGWIMSERMDTGKVEVQACDQCRRGSDAAAGQRALEWYAGLQKLRPYDTCSLAHTVQGHIQAKLGGPPDDNDVVMFPGTAKYIWSLCEHVINADCRHPRH